MWVFYPLEAITDPSFQTMAEIGLLF